MAIFEINKSNLVYNVNYIRKRLNNGVKLCAMVKGNAYGHNIEVVSKIIEPFVDYFGVATIEEGIALRHSGVEKNILCVGKCTDDKLYDASKYNIEVSVEDFGQLKNLESSKLKIKMHLKIDTGMHRLGFNDLKEFSKALSLIKNSKNLRLLGVFTHFSVASVENYNNQLKTFEKYLKLCPKNIIVHCSNSLASRYNSLQYDMVRVGLSIYGYGESHLKKVLKVKSKVISIRHIKKGEKVGYDGSFIATNDTIIGTIFLGYYDGINRKLSNNGYVRINNNRYRIVGNICMDMFMVEIDNSIKVGDEVVIFENADEWAEKCQTIPYEIITSFKSERMEIKIIK